ncbi:MAG: AraC family transcriptional regulator [Myxococcota bacterium]
MTGLRDVRVNRAVDHVRNHLRSALTIASLARVAHVSPFHFARLFKASTGETVTRFVQRARLERAAALMQRSPRRELGDIALDAGFRSASNFARVFRTHYGQAPREWDRVSPLADRFPGFEDALAPFRANPPPLHPRRIAIPEQTVAYVRVPTPFVDDAKLDSGMNTLRAALARSGMQVGAFVGASWDHPDATSLDRVCFDLGVVVPDDVRIEDLSVHRWPAHEAVAVHVNGPRPHLALAWEALYEWIVRTQATPLDLPSVKWFRRPPDAARWSHFDVDCAIPLRT